MALDSDQGRRTFLRWLIGLGSATAVAIGALPGVSYLLDPLLRATPGKAQWRKVAKLSRLDETPVAVPIIGDEVDAWRRSPARRLGTVWLRKAPTGEIHALSAECPHLGCSLGFDDGRKVFTCPCHESAFSLSGEVQMGPAPRAMDPLEVRVEGEDVEVRFIRFRTQTEKREELG
jgi:menaquinol-cytochrome c reductase iron-sulfur subunit